MEHALTQQIGLRAPIHLPLERFESVDLTLHLAGAPAARQGRLDGSAVPTHSVHETEELGQSAVRRGMQPAMQSGAGTGAEQQAEALQQVLGGPDGCRSVAEPLHVAALLAVERLIQAHAPRSPAALARGVPQSRVSALVRLAEQEPARLPPRGRKRRPGRSRQPPLLPAPPPAHPAGSRAAVGSVTAARAPPALKTR